MTVNAAHLNVTSVDNPHHAPQSVKQFMAVLGRPCRYRLPITHTRIKNAPFTHYLNRKECMHNGASTADGQAVAKAVLQ